MSIKKNDFIEIEFTGRIKDGGVFDSNIKEELQKLNPKAEAKPFIFAIGQGMFLKGIDDFLIGKQEKPTSYEIELPPEKSFGQRNPKFVQVMPMKIFVQQKLNPIAGAMFNFDGRPAKVLSVSGGRVIVDFNNPLAGKTVIYKINLKRKVDDLDEKIKSLIDFLFKMDLRFEVKDNTITIHVEKQIVDFVKLFKGKFKDVLGLELEVHGLNENLKVKK